MCIWKETPGEKKKKALQKYILFVLVEPSIGLIIMDKKKKYSFPGKYYPLISQEFSP